MSTKSTKNNKQLSYPCIVEIKMAMGQKRKSEVIRAIDRVSGEDLSKSIVYPTLRNAFYAGVDLVKESIDSKWVRIEKTEAEARQITVDGEVTGIDVAPAPAPAAAKQPKAKKAKAPKAAATAKPSGKGKTKISTTGALTIDKDEPTDADIQEIEDLLAMDQDQAIEMFDDLTTL